MDDAKYEQALQIILHAGNAKSHAMIAIEAAEKSQFEQAADELEKANDEMGEAHKLQFDLVRAEASGTPVEVTIILVHAQDHLTMAIMSIDFAERFIRLYRIRAGLPVEDDDAV